MRLTTLILPAVLLGLAVLGSLVVAALRPRPRPLPLPVRVRPRTLRHPER